ncbi:MAG: hypothetical protein Q9175_002079, partial [Cornicularia normoerica]
MPASPKAASAQRSIHARRNRLRRGAPGSATAGGTRSSDESEGRSEEGEVRAGLVSNNRFAVLRPKEPAPGIQEERVSSLSLDPSLCHEGPIALPFQTDILPIDQTSSEKIKNKSLAPTSPLIPCSKRPSMPRLTPQTPAYLTRIEPNQQLSAPAAASISPAKPQAQPSPLVLQADAQSAQGSKPTSALARISPDFDTAAPYLSLLAPRPAPTLPSPPTPQNPLPNLGLATLPVHPSLDFEPLTSPRFCGPKPLQLSPPVPTTIDNFYSDDQMCHIIKTTSGWFFSIAAETAAANEE